MTEIDRLQQKYERAKAMQAHARKTYGAASWCYQAAAETTLSAYRELAKMRAKPVSNFGLAPVKRQGTTVCRFCYFPPAECVCNGPAAAR